jgi:hypothetical protein
VSCYVKRRQPPDLFVDDLNCLLNICDCSVTVVGDERLPSSSINRALVSLVSSHISLPLAAYSLLFSSTPPWARARKAEAPRTTPATRGSASRLLLRRTSAIPSPRDRRSMPLPWHRLATQTIPGSDESEVSSDEGNSSDSSEEGSDGDNDGEGNSDDGGDGDDGGDDDGNGDSSKGDDKGGSGSGDGKGGSGNGKASG